MSIKNHIFKVFLVIFILLFSIYYFVTWHCVQCHVFYRSTCRRNDDIVRAVPTSALGPRRARPISSEFGRPGIVNMKANELKRGLLQTRNGRCWAAASAAGGFFGGF